LKYQACVAKASYPAERKRVSR